MDHCTSVPNLGRARPRPLSPLDRPKPLEGSPSSEEDYPRTSLSSPKRRSLRPMEVDPLQRPPRPRMSALSSTSLRSDSPAPRPETPAPLRDDFRSSPSAGVAVIYFDFDGTLTATPGDRAARRTKQLELCDRAPMLGPRLKILKDQGASLGIISKSTENTIRSALEAANLANLFDAPLVAKAVGFEEKVGFRWFSMLFAASWELFQLHKVFRRPRPVPSGPLVRAGPHPDAALRAGHLARDPAGLCGAYRDELRRVPRSPSHGAFIS